MLFSNMEKDRKRLGDLPLFNKAVNPTSPTCQILSNCIFFFLIKVIGAKIIMMEKFPTVLSWRQVHFFFCYRFKFLAQRSFLYVLSAEKLDKLPLTSIK